MTELKGYHAHVYYDAATKPAAEKLRDALIGKFKVEGRRLQRRAARAAPDLAVQRDLRDPGVPEHRALADAEPRGARRSGSSADRKLLRRPQQECAVARHPGADEARHPAAEIQRGPAADRPAGVSFDHGGTEGTEKVFYVERTRRPAKAGIHAPGRRSVDSGLCAGMTFCVFLRALRVSVVNYENRGGKPWPRSWEWAARIGR